MKRRKFSFKNWATKLQIRKYSSCCFVFKDGACFLDKYYRTYEACLRALQRYSRRYYGEKAI